MGIGTSYSAFTLNRKFGPPIGFLPSEADLGASVLNVANKSYWALTIGGYLTQGAPRTVLLSMTTDF
ncbi:TonB-dependent siderophore receptor [Caballeronia temeraria]|uniref:TonB-dependent siderophore receptor n=1 Tax=Caballeronia temeraria TaxID=1777137 RepID=A0A158AV34_9BURK|nr:TonB-dependent siderophore receptor [Caballeronia temeraria]